MFVLQQEFLKNFDQKLTKRFVNTDKFSNNDINKFILLLRKGVNTYEYMVDWEKFNETSLSEKKGFYSHLNMEVITNANYTHARRSL